MNERTMIVATTLTDLHKEPSFLAEMLRQVFNGMSVQVLEEQGLWCRVRMGDDGYEGWAYRPYLSDASTAIQATHRVTHVSAPVFIDERASRVRTRLMAGSDVRFVETDRTGGDVSRVQLAGGTGGWIPSSAI